MALLNPVKALKRPALNQGRWHGYIVNNDDSQDPKSNGKKRQRCRIRIPQLHRGIPDDQLPWCMPASSGQAHAGAGVGSVDIPPEGALVEVVFDEDDPHNPRYGRSPPVDSVNEDNELLNEDYPKTTGYVDDAGNKWSYNKQRKETLYQHPSGASMFFDGAGNISFSSPGKVTMSGAQGVDVVGGPVNINGSAIQLKGPTSINGAGAGMSASSPPARATPNIASRRNQGQL